MPNENLETQRNGGNGGLGIFDSISSAYSFPLCFKGFAGTSKKTKGLNADG
jgi:hypothetical protein